MKIKFSLNKFAKLDNIDSYPLEHVYKLQEIYDKYIDESKGVDVDFPEFEFNSKGKKVNSRVSTESESDNVNLE